MAERPMPSPVLPQPVMPQPLARHQVEAILYLADRIAFTDLNISSTEKGAIQLLAAQANQPQFRSQPWYEHLSDDAACERLDTPEARKGALVVLRYVVRSDARVEAAECAFFTQIQDRLGVDAVQIPKDITQHQKVALAYLGKV